MRHFAEEAFHIDKRAMSAWFKNRTPQAAKVKPKAVTGNVTNSSAASRTSSGDRRTASADLSAAFGTAAVAAVETLPAVASGGTWGERLAATMEAHPVGISAAASMPLQRLGSHLYHYSAADDAGNDAELRQRCLPAIMDQQRHPSEVGGGSSDPSSGRTSNPLPSSPFTAGISAQRRRFASEGLGAAWITQQHEASGSSSSVSPLLTATFSAAAAAVDHQQARIKANAAEAYRKLQQQSEDQPGGGPLLGGGNIISARPQMPLAGEPPDRGGLLPSSTAALAANDMHEYYSCLRSSALNVTANLARSSDVGVLHSPPAAAAPGVAAAGGHHVPQGRVGGGLNMMWSAESSLSLQKSDVEMLQADLAAYGLMGDDETQPAQRRRRLLAAALLERPAVAADCALRPTPAEGSTSDGPLALQNSLLALRRGLFVGAPSSIQGQEDEEGEGDGKQEEGDGGSSL